MHVQCDNIIDVLLIHVHFHQNVNYNYSKIATETYQVVWFCIRCTVNICI